MEITPEKIAFIDKLFHQPTPTPLEQIKKRFLLSDQEVYELLVVWVSLRLKK